MAEQPTIGIPYTAMPDQPVSDWSISIYGELKNWAEEHHGKWDWWSPGYLVLTIDRIADVEIEPVFLHTWDEELTVELRHWDTHFPDWNTGLTDEPGPIAEQARAVADDWLRGQFALAVYFAGDEWCGSKTIDADEDHHTKMADIEWIKDFGPKRVELRWADRGRFEQFRFSNDQLVSS